MMDCGMHMGYNDEVGSSLTWTGLLIVAYLIT